MQESPVKEINGGNFPPPTRGRDQLDPFLALLERQLADMSLTEVCRLQKQITRVFDLRFRRWVPPVANR